jgi:recombination protein RecT
MTSLKSLLESQRQSIQQILPKHLSADRILKVALVAASRNPLLLECDAMSILRSVMSSSQLGLEPDGPLGSAYLVPFKNKNGRMEAQLIVGYRGLIDLARRSGQIVSIEAHVVREKDKFECSFGLEPVLKHVPDWSDDPGKQIAVYAVAKLKDGGVQAEVMTKHEVDAIRKRSRAGNFGPWVTDYEEMSRKTVVKRLAKYLPISVELSQALEVDNAADTGEMAVMDVEIKDVGGIAVEEKEQGASKSDALAAKLGGAPESIVPPAATLEDELRIGNLWDQAVSLGEKCGYKQTLAEDKANAAMREGEVALVSLVQSLTELAKAAGK